MRSELLLILILCALHVRSATVIISPSSSWFSELSNLAAGDVAIVEPGFFFVTIFRNNSNTSQAHIL